MPPMRPLQQTMAERASLPSACAFIFSTVHTLYVLGSVVVLGTSAFDLSHLASHSPQRTASGTRRGLAQHTYVLCATHQTLLHSLNSMV
jgi:hypothetical protein